MKKVLVVIGLMLIMAGCAATPEQQLYRGYKSVTATAKSTTRLVERDAISKEDANNVLTAGRLMKSSLDEGKRQLEDCRAAEAAGQPVDCSKNFSISVGSGVLLNLESILQAEERKRK